MKKYSVPVFIQTTASKMIGTVECDSIREYNVLSDKLWESVDFESPSINSTNDFDLSDWDIADITKRDLSYYLTNEKESI